MEEWQADSNPNPEARYAVTVAYMALSRIVGAVWGSPRTVTRVWPGYLPGGERALKIELEPQARELDLESKLGHQFGDEEARAWMEVNHLPTSIGTWKVLYTYPNEPSARSALEALFLQEQIMDVTGGNGGSEEESPDEGPPQPTAGPRF